MLNPISSAEARSGYRLWIRFADRVEGEVSLTHLVGKGVFEAWKDQELFAAVGVDPQSGTVVWPGGIDLAPDALYEKITGTSASKGAPHSS